MTTPTVADAGLDRALGFLGALILPSGQRLADSWAADPWLRDEICIPALAKRPDGKPANRYCWTELPKGAAKTTTGAALMLVEAATEPATHCYVLATDQEQAGIALDALTGLISRYPRLQAAIKQRQNLFTFSNGSRIQIMASHEPSFHGIAATARRVRFGCDELTQWPTPAMYHAALASMAKVPDSALWVLTNAGLLDSWQAEARDQLEAAGAHTFISEPGWLPSWVSQADVDALKATLPLPLWRRYFRNEWVSGVADQAITAEDWDSCRADIPPLDSASPVVVGVDAATTGDSFAIVAVSRAPRSGRALASELVPYTQHGFSLFVPASTPEPEAWIRAVKIWRPPDGGGAIDFRDPYLWLSAFVKDHNVACVVFDVWQLHSWSEDFRREHQVWLEEFNQGPQRAQADTDLLQLIRAHRLRHDGDGELRSHALNASLKLQVAEDSRARFVKAHPSKKIDALVALSMAAHQCLYLNL